MTVKRKRRASNSFPFYLLIPAFLLLGIFVFYPVARVFGYSTWHYTALRPKETAFVGLGNFATILQYDLFYLSLKNSMIYAATTTVVQFLLGLWLALLLRHMKTGSGLYRTLVFAPWALSGVLTSIIWQMVFNGSFGILNDILLRLGLIKEAVVWTATPRLAMMCVIVATIWRGIPYFGISLLGAMLSIPNDLYESAAIDGASGIKCFFNITLPYIKETVVLTTILRFIWTFNDVDIIHSFTGGGPNNGTLTLPIYITRETLTHLNFGYGSALTVILTLVLLVLTSIYLGAMKTSDDFAA